MLLLVSAGWLGLVVTLAVFAPWLPLRHPSKDIDYYAVAAGPSAEHWLGTDELGRDMLSRLVWGARVSLVVGVGSVAAGALVGTTLGIVAGYFRGRVDALISWLVDVLLAFPALVLALAIAAYLGQGTGNVTLAIAVVAVPAFTRVARATTMSYTERDFVVAARSIGERNHRILFGEVAPNVAPTISTYAFVAVAVAIVAEGGLSFLGLSVAPPTPSWGSMIAGGRRELDRAAHVALIPALVMFFTVLSLNLLGERLRDRLDLREVKM
jgi:peptide/nickel transport system permease protein